MKKIYVIDDDRDIVEAITMVLEKEGYEIGSQNDDIDVVENVLGFGPDLIILDVIFPENEAAGFEMARLLKGDDRVRSIPILMLSAVNEKGSYAGTFSNKDRDDLYLPVDQFVEKPLVPQELIKKVKALIK